MIIGKTIKKAKFTKPTEDIRSELVLTFTDGTILTVVTHEQMDFFEQENENTERDWLHPSTLR